MFKRWKYIFVIGIMSTAAVLSACSSRMPSGTNNMAMDTKEEIVERSDDTSMVEEKMAVSNEGIQLNTSTNINRKIIKTGVINLETKSFDPSVQGIIDEVQKMGGFIQNCSIDGSDVYKQYSRRNASITLRIPNAKFDQFMNESNQFGNITSKSIQGEDVTDQYMDTEIRLGTLEIQAERLKELLKQSGDLDKLFKIEKELANVTYEIESLKGTLKKYDSLIDYSTIEVYVQETAVYQEPIKEDTFIDRIGNTFNRSVDGLVSIMQGITLMIIALVPFLIIIVPIALVVVWIVRKRIKKNIKQDKID